LVFLPWNTSQSFEMSYNKLEHFVRHDRTSFPVNKVGVE
jgi:hypothetical protein